MSGRSPFSKKSLESLHAPKRDYLEELNIPPEIAAFIRKNSKILQIFALCIIAAIGLWIGYGNWQQGREQKAADMFAQAMAQQDKNARHQALTALVDEYPASGAATWSRIELGHQAQDTGEFDKAIENYQAALDKVAAKNPVVPLIKLRLAAAYEAKGDLDQAIAQYQELTEVAGFNDEAFLGMGRIYELKKEPEKARGAYRKLVEKEDGLDPEAKNLAEEKLRRLPAPPDSQ